jgi:hypothetical protein
MAAASSAAGSGLPRPPLLPLPPLHPLPDPAQHPNSRAHVLTSTVLYPVQQLSATRSRLRVQRFASVPVRDAILCTSVREDFVLRPVEHPGFVPTTIEPRWKAWSVVDPSRLGTTVSLPVPQLVANDAFVEARRRALHIGGEVVAPEPLGVASRPKFALKESRALPAHHEAFPMSVDLQLHEEQLCQRLAKDIKQPVYEDTVWPRAIKGYRPVLPSGADVLAHYQNVVLYDPGLPEDRQLDPHFGIGLFGHLRNGLSVVIRALAKTETKVSSHILKQSPMHAESKLDGPVEKAKLVLCDYIILVALHFWLLARGRWLELDPKQIKAEFFQPSYLFYFHHKTDFNVKRSEQEEKKAKKMNQSKRRKGAMKAEPVKQEEPDSDATESDEEPPAAAAAAAASASAAYRRGKRKTPAVDVEEENEGAAAVVRGAAEVPQRMSQLLDSARGKDGHGLLTPFLFTVFIYVRARMRELAASAADTKPDSIQNACRLLELEDSLVNVRVETRTKNHENFFCCMRMKSHWIPDFAKKINTQSKENLLGEMKHKFYARNNKDGLLMKTVQPTGERKLIGAWRYANPRFWSHLTLSPDGPLVQSELHAFPVMEPNQADATGIPVHQACVLRRLMFLLNAENSKFVFEAFSKLGKCERSGVFFGAPRIKSVDFRARFVQSSVPEADSILKRALDLEFAVVLPPVVPPSVLRYSLFIDEEVGRPYVPALSRDRASLPSTDEQDILSMSKQWWIALAEVGRASATAKTMPLRTVDDLVNLGVLCTGSRTPAEAARLKALHRNECLRLLGGTSAGRCLLDPNAKMEEKHLAIKTDVFRLSPVERTQLARLAGVEGRLNKPALWSLLLKICQTEAQAVSTYVHHVRSDAAPFKPSEAELFGLLLDLQHQSLLERQSDVEQFAEVWNVYNRASDRSPVLVAFLAGMDSAWDHCSRAKAEEGSLSHLLTQLLKKDLPWLSCHVLLPTGQEVEVVPAELKLFLSSVLDSHNRSAASSLLTDDSRFRLTPSFFPQTLQRCALSKDQGRVVFRVKPEADNVFRMKFARFFEADKDKPPDTFMSSGLHVQDVAEFFQWYYYTVYIRSLVQCFPVLCPDSSAIFQQRARELHPVTWVEHLAIADSTPALTKQLYVMLKNASTRELLADLQTADRMNQVVSAEAEHFLLALEIALRGNDELDFCGDAKMRMAELQSLVARVLKRRRESIVGAAVGQGAAAASVVGAMEGGNARSVRERVFDACVRKCTSALVATGTISDALLHDVFHELITVVEFDAQYNAAQVTGQVMKMVANKIAASQDERIRVLLDKLNKLALVWRPVSQDRGGVPARLFATVGAMLRGHMYELFNAAPGR